MFGSVLLSLDWEATAGADRYLQKIPQRVYNKDTGSVHTKVRRYHNISNLCEGRRIDSVKFMKLYLASTQVWMIMYSRTVVFACGND